MPPCHGGGRGFESRPVRKKAQHKRWAFCILSHFVYIIESLVDGTLYKGYSTDCLHRLEQHNNGESQYTSGKMPWILVFVQEFATKREALIAEKKLKRCNSQYLRWLMEQPANLLKTLELG